MEITHAIYTTITVASRMTAANNSSKIAQNAIKQFIADLPGGIIPASYIKKLHDALTVLDNAQNLTTQQQIRKYLVNMEQPVEPTQPTAPVQPETDPKTDLVFVDEFEAHGGKLQPGREIYTMNDEHPYLCGIYVCHDDRNKKIIVEKDGGRVGILPHLIAVEIEYKPIYK